MDRSGVDTCRINIATITGKRTIQRSGPIKHRSVIDLTDALNQNSHTTTLEQETCRAGSLEFSRFDPIDHWDTKEFEL